MRKINLILVPTIVCICFAAACTPPLPAATNAPTPSVFEHTQLYAITTKTKTPISGFQENNATITAIIATRRAGGTAVVAGMTTSPTPTLETPMPTFVPPPLPTPVPTSWKEFHSTEEGISFRYPAEWKEESAGRYSGPDGFVTVSKLDFPESLFDSIQSFCVLDANFDRPAAFGGHPLIMGLGNWFTGLQGAETRGCTVSPYAATDSNAEAVLYARLPVPQMKDKLLVIRSDSTHFASILSTLSYLVTPVLPTQTSCKTMQQTDARVTLDNTAVNITEYPIADASCDLKGSALPMNFTHKDDPMGAKLALARSDGLRQLGTIDDLALVPFGYRLVENNGSTLSFNLYKGEPVVIAGIAWLYELGRVSVNTAGDDFILWVRDDSTNAPPIEVSTSGIRTLTVWDEGWNTAWAGNDRVGYVYSKERLFGSGAPREIELTRNGSVAQTYAISEAGGAGFPVHSFGSWEGHWLLEMDNVVIQDGAALNRKLGYAEMFEWTLMKEKPFFFFEKDGRYGMNYAGAELAVRYDDILHGELCCDYSLYNIMTTPEEAWFYALRGGTWYLVNLQAK